MGDTEDDVRIHPRDVEEPRFGEGFPASHDNKAHPKVVSLAHDVTDLIVSEFFFRCRPDGFFVTSRAVEVALMGDTEDDDGWDVRTLFFVVFPSLGRCSLPPDGLEEEQGLGGMAEADFDGVGEEDAQSVVETEPEIVGRHIVSWGRIMTVS